MVLVLWPSTGTIRVQQTKEVALLVLIALLHLHGQIRTQESKALTPPGTSWVTLGKSLNVFLSLSLHICRMGTGLLAYLLHWWSSR